MLSRVRAAAQFQVPHHNGMTFKQIPRIEQPLSHEAVLQRGRYFSLAFDMLNMAGGGSFLRRT